jgi:hypothetical protein
MLIRYRNTDLDLHASFDLDPLVSAFEQGGAWNLGVTLGGDGLWYAIVEAGDRIETPEASITDLLRVIEGLTGEARELWSRCELREFNIGYDSGHEPWAFNQGLTNDTLMRMARCGASLRITLYPPDDDA